MKTLWNKETGEKREYEAVNAKEILQHSPDLYTDVDPDPPKKDKDGNLVDKDGNPVGTGPQNVANVENEFRREPVGDDVPGPEREGVIIRNPVSDQPRMAPRAEEGAAAAVAADVARGPQGMFYVMDKGQRVSSGYKTEAEAKAASAKMTADKAAADKAAKDKAAAAAAALAKK